MIPTIAAILTQPNQPASVNESSSSSSGDSTSSSSLRHSSSSSASPFSSSSSLSSDSTLESASSSSESSKSSSSPDLSLQSESSLSSGSSKSSSSTQSNLSSSSSEKSDNSSSSSSSGYKAKVIGFYRRQFATIDGAVHNEIVLQLDQPSPLVEDLIPVFITISGVTGIANGTYQVSLNLYEFEDDPPYPSDFEIGIIATSSAATGIVNGVAVFDFGDVSSSSDSSSESPLSSSSSLEISEGGLSSQSDSSSSQFLMSSSSSPLQSSSSDGDFSGVGAIPSLKLWIDADTQVGVSSLPRTFSFLRNYADGSVMTGAVPFLFRNGFLAEPTFSYKDHIPLTCPIGFEVLTCFFAIKSNRWVNKNSLIKTPAWEFYQKGDRLYFEFGSVKYRSRKPIGEPVSNKLMVGIQLNKTKVVFHYADKVDTFYFNTASSSSSGTEEFVTPYFQIFDTSDFEIGEVIMTNTIIGNGVTSDIKRYLINKWGLMADIEHGIYSTSSSLESLSSESSEDSLESSSHSSLITGSTSSQSSSSSGLSSISSKSSSSSP